MPIVGRLNYQSINLSIVKFFDKAFMYLEYTFITGQPLYNTHPGPKVYINYLYNYVIGLNIWNYLCKR